MTQRTRDSNNAPPPPKRAAPQIGRPNKSEYALVVNVQRKVRGLYVRHSSRTLVLKNAPWDVDRFAALVERMARKETGHAVEARPTTKEIVL